MYDSFTQLIGSELQVRNLDSYKIPTNQLIDKLIERSYLKNIYLLGNPAPNQYARDLTGYIPLLKKINDRLNVKYIDLNDVYDCQFSLIRDASINISAEDLINGEIELTSIPKGSNFMNYEIWYNNEDITNKTAVVYTGYAYSINRSLSGTSLNTSLVNGNQTLNNLHPKLKFLNNIPISGNITIKYSTLLWSNDSCHLNDLGRELYSTSILKGI